LDSDAIAAVTVPFFIFGLPMLAWIMFRIMAHRERMAMIQRGFGPGPIPKDAAAFAARAAAPAGPEAYTVSDAQNTLRKGIRLTFIGLAITIGLSFIGWHEGHFGPWIEPGPWLLGGLVPLFVGLAQVIIALISGATLGPFHGDAGLRGAQQQPYDPSLAPPHVPPPAQGTYENGPFGYRPGSTPGLPVPPSPPDRR